MNSWAVRWKNGQFIAMYVPPGYMQFLCLKMLRIFKFAQTFRTQEHVCMCVYVCVCVCMYVCMYVCICMYVCMYVCMHACMYACMYVCMSSNDSITDARLRV